MKARGPQQQERIRQRMAGMPVEDLARRSGVNTTALRRGRVKTAADVQGGCTVRDLEDIRERRAKVRQKI